MSRVTPSGGGGGGAAAKLATIYSCRQAMHKSGDYNEIQGKSPHYSYVSPQKGLLYCEQLHRSGWQARQETPLL